MNPLPIDEILPNVLTAIKTHSAVVIQAPPGAGKTTGVPLALLKDDFFRGQRILLLEPRRLAASNASRWMASLLGETVGKTVGYCIRFERKVSEATSIEVVTEGILTRRLHSDPGLEGVGAVIFDEFHERSLHTDLALALCRDAQQGLRPDLKIVVMSATLEAAPIAALLDDAPLITSEGKAFPVEVRYLPSPGNSVAASAAAAVLKALDETAGDILVFLPGAGEIARCEKLLQAVIKGPPPLIYPLFGDLPFDCQEKAILPAARRKVILATNIAETSLTIEGVRVVVDSGMAKQSRFDPASGLNRLITGRISAASATQRAGRAGRQGPGICYRLWSEHVQATLLPQTAPEIRTTDLSGLALDLALWGVKDPCSLTWLDPPPASALAEGRSLLRQLAAIDSQGQITDVGRNMAALPVHPRLARLLVEGRHLRSGGTACDMAALLSERDIFRQNRQNSESSGSDIMDRLEALQNWRNGNRDYTRIDNVACRTVERISNQFRQILRIGEPFQQLSPETEGILLAMAYPDRLARQREPGSRRYLLATGTGAVLSARSNLSDTPWIIAVSIDGGDGGEGIIHLAATIGVEEVRRIYADAIVVQRLVSWDRQQRRVVSRREERLGALVLTSTQITPTDDELKAALVEGLNRGQGIDELNWTPEAEQLRARVCFLARIFPNEGWPDFSKAKLAISISSWLGPYLLGIKSLDALARLDLVKPLVTMLTWEQQRKLNAEAPSHLTVPSGSTLRLLYSEAASPVLEVKLQELFGLAETPKIARSRVPVVLHLLSPGRRPIQITTDLKNFWDNVYPEVRKELRGRYPKHPWPEDPWNALPTAKTKRASTMKTY